MLCMTMPYTYGRKDLHPAVFLEWSSDPTYVYALHDYARYATYGSKD